MMIEVMSKENLKFEIFSWLDDLKKNEELDIKITKCEVLKGTYDLEISRKKKSK